MGSSRAAYSTRGQGAGRDALRSTRYNLFNERNDSYLLHVCYLTLLFFPSRVALVRPRHACMCVSVHVLHGVLHGVLRVPYKIIIIFIILFCTSRLLV